MAYSCNMNCKESAICSFFQELPQSLNTILGNRPKPDRPPQKCDLPCRNISSFPGRRRRAELNHLPVTTTSDALVRSFVRSRPEFLALKHKSRILGHSSNPVCGFSMMEQVRLCAVWPMENWLGSSLNQIQGWTTV